MHLSNHIVALSVRKVMWRTDVMSTFGVVLLIMYIHHPHADKSLWPPWYPYQYLIN